MKGFLLFWITSGLFVSDFARERGEASVGGDHLVTVGETDIDSEYQKIWRQKLLVTPGDVARCIWLPGNVGTEGAISVYRDLNKKGGLPGGYWLTVTQASDPLWRSVQTRGAAPATNPKKIMVQRYDLPLPESTALAINNVWLKMLSHERSPRNSKPISLDSSTELFSANTPSKILIGKLDKSPSNKLSLALLDLANALLEYFNYSPLERPNRAHQIEKEASALLERANSAYGKNR